MLCWIHWNGHFFIICCYKGYILWCGSSVINKNQPVIPYQPNHQSIAAAISTFLLLLALYISPLHPPNPPPTPSPLLVTFVTPTISLITMDPTLVPWFSPLHHPIPYTHMFQYRSRICCLTILWDSTAPTTSLGLILNTFLLPRDSPYSAWPTSPSNNDVLNVTSSTAVIFYPRPIISDWCMNKNLPFHSISLQLWCYDWI